MLYVDSRAGSKDLLKPLQKLLGAETVESTILEFGDIAFTGRGVQDKPLDIGVEHKTLGDITQCLRDGRFAGHQLPGLMKMYDYAWLLIEGAWRVDTAGYMTGYQGPRRGWRPLPGKMRASEFEKHLLTFELCGGVHVHVVATRADALRFLGTLYRWFSDRGLDAHTSHLAVHTPASFQAVSKFRQAVMTWPGIGLNTSRAAEVLFKGSVRTAGLASDTAWADMDVEGKRFGMPRATKLVDFLRGPR